MRLIPKPIYTSYYELFDLSQLNHFSINLTDFQYRKVLIITKPYVSIMAVKGHWWGAILVYERRLVSRGARSLIWITLSNIRL